MALYVNTNVSSLNAQRKLANSTNDLNVNYQRLASGLRINSAKDDAAGLSISDRLTSQINGLNQGNRNANDSIALLQTMEGALDETVNMLQRVRTLAVQAANGTYTSEDRLAIQSEVTQLCAEVTRISEKTTFAGARILDGAENPIRGNHLNPSNLLSSGILSFQVGSNHDDTISLDFSVGFSMDSIRAELGLVVEMVANGKTGTRSGLLKEPDKTIRWSVSSQSSAQVTLDNIDLFIGFVDSKRAELGAVQNRMEATIRNQSSIAENTSDARSRIRDADFANETASLTQNNIIQQASQSVLTQANQRPQIALSLMGNS